MLKAVSTSGGGGGGGSGTVTEVDTGAGLTGGPITTSGTVSLDLTHVNAFTGQQYFAQATLTDASPITWNLSTQQAAYVLLTAAIGATRQLQNPTNLKVGASYTLIVQQSSTGNNALTYGTLYKFPGGVAPILSVGVNAIDILTFISDGTNMYGVSQLAFA